MIDRFYAAAYQNVKKISLFFAGMGKFGASRLSYIESDVGYSSLVRMRLARYTLGRVVPSSYSSWV